MYQIDNSTAVAAQPPSTAAGNAGYFTDGNIAAAQPPTIFPAEFANMLMLEILNAVKAAGIVPDKTKFNQLALAIGGGRTSYGHDSGVANAYALALGQAPAALLDGMVVCFLAANPNTGASTLNLNGIGAQPILGTAHAALRGGEIVANGFVRVQWSTALAAWVILDNTGGIQEGATAAQFDNSIKLATTAFVKAAGIQFPTTFLNVTNAQAIPASAAGGIVNCYGTNGAFAVTLPAVASLPIGATITFITSTSGPVTLTPAAGGDGFGSASSLVLQPFDTVTIQAAGGNTWWILYGSGQLPSAPGFSKNLVTNGWQKNPSGQIFQWGQATANSTSDTTVNFPVAFPNACLTLGVSTGYTTGSGTTGYACGGSQTKTNFVTRSNSGSLGITWWAVGW